MDISNIGKFSRVDTVSDKPIIDAGIGVAQKGGKILKSVSDIGETILKPVDQLVNAVTPYTRSAYKGISVDQARSEIDKYNKQKDLEKQQFEAQVNEILRAKNASQEFGQIAGELAAWLIPQTKITKLAEPFGIGTRMAIEGIGGAATGAVIDGDNRLEGALYGGLGGVGGELVAPVFSGLLKSTQKVGGLKNVFKRGSKDIVETTGKDIDSLLAEQDKIINTSKNPNEIKVARKNKFDLLKQKEADSSILDKFKQKTPEEYKNKALDNTAELLQLDHKKEAYGRLGKYTEPEIEATRLIRDTDHPIKSFQDLSDTFYGKLKEIDATRSSLIKDKLKQKVDIENSLLKATEKMNKYLDNGELDIAGKIEELIKKERGLGLTTIKDVEKRKKFLDGMLSNLYDDAGGLKPLSQTEKVEQQALMSIKDGYKDTLNKVGGSQYAKLGRTRAALNKAFGKSTELRSRAKNAIKDIDFDAMNFKQRAKVIADKLPYIKDAFDKGLIKIDTKADLLDALVEDKIRQIRLYSQKGSSLGTSYKSKLPEATAPKVEKSQMQSQNKGLPKELKKDNVSSLNNTTKEAIKKLGEDLKVKQTQLTKAEHTLEKLNKKPKTAKVKALIIKVKEKIKVLIKDIQGIQTKIKTFIKEAGGSEKGAVDFGADLGKSKSITSDIAKAKAEGKSFEEFITPNEKAINDYTQNLNWSFKSDYTFD